MSVKKIKSQYHYALKQNGVRKKDLIIMESSQIENLTSEKQTIISYLQQNFPFNYLVQTFPYIFNLGQIQVYVTGSILTKKFGKESDVDIFLRGNDVDHLDLSNLLLFAIDFNKRFGHYLHIHPTTGFKEEKQLLLKDIKI